MRILAEVKRLDDGPSVLTDIVDFLRGELNPRERRSGWDRGSLRFARYSPKTIRTTDATFLKLFRSFVDAWIDSGIDKAEIEEPWKRTLEGVPKGESKSLHDILFEWFPRYRPIAMIGNDGETVFFDQGPDLEGLTPEGYAREMAIYYFKQLLDCSSRYRLARCAKPSCPVPYFERRRSPRKLIKRGVYCGAHPSIGAAERTRHFRKQRTEKLLDAAAAAWQEWKPGRKKDKQTAYVAWKLRPVCKLLSIPEITVKWVSQNREEILKRVEERCNAKS